jgi:hypothetical protein
MNSIFEDLLIMKRQKENNTYLEKAKQNLVGEYIWNKKRLLNKIVSSNIKTFKQYVHEVFTDRARGDRTLPAFNFPIKWIQIFFCMLDKGVCENFKDQNITSVEEWTFDEEQWKSNNMPTDRILILLEFLNYKLNISFRKTTDEYLISRLLKKIDLDKKLPAGWTRVIKKNDENLYKNYTDNTLLLHKLDFDKKLPDGWTMKPETNIEAPETNIEAPVYQNPQNDPYKKLEGYKFFYLNNTQNKFYERIQVNNVPITLIPNEQKFSVDKIVTILTEQCLHVDSDVKCGSKKGVDSYCCEWHTCSKCSKESYGGYCIDCLTKKLPSIFFKEIDKHLKIEKLNQSEPLHFKIGFDTKYTLYIKGGEAEKNKILPFPIETTNEELKVNINDDEYKDKNFYHLLDKLINNYELLASAKILLELKEEKERKILLGIN